MTPLYAQNYDFSDYNILAVDDIPLNILLVQKMLSRIEFTKTDAKRFLAGKTTKKSHLLDRKGQEFKAELIMEETPDNPFGPVFRVVEGTIETKDTDPSQIRTDTVKIQDKNTAPA